MYRVNVYILNSKPGDIVKEGDRNYDAFKAWAARKDTRSGMLICTPYADPAPVAAEDVAVPEGQIGPEASYSESAPVAIETAAASEEHEDPKASKLKDVRRK